MPERTIIFANGDLGDPQRLKALLSPDDWLVAADGGLRHLTVLGQVPDLIIGDLDSADPEQVSQARWAGCEVRRFPVDKNETDLELAINAALQSGSKTVWIAGALGGRLDQTLANLFLLTRSDLEGLDVRLEDGREEVIVIRSTATIKGFPGDTVSLLPLSEKVMGVTTHGLKYPLIDESLDQERTRGVSNVILSHEAFVTVKSGTLICIHSRCGQANDMKPGVNNDQ